MDDEKRVPFITTKKTRLNRHVYSSFITTTMITMMMMMMIQESEKVFYKSWFFFSLLNTKLWVMWRKCCFFCLNTKENFCFKKNGFLMAIIGNKFFIYTKVEWRLKRKFFRSHLHFFFLLSHSNPWWMRFLFSMVGGETR